MTTRRKQIEEAAKQYTGPISEEDWSSFSYSGFIEGAEWADANPKPNQLTEFEQVINETARIQIERLQSDKATLLSTMTDFEDKIEEMLSQQNTLVDALKFYAEVFPVPMEVRAHNKEDKKFEELSSALLNQFHTVAREALKKIGEIE